MDRARMLQEGLLPSEDAAKSLRSPGVPPGLFTQVIHLFHTKQNTKTLFFYLNFSTLLAYSF